MKLVNAQQARRVLDRIVGYQGSQLLWNKVRRGLSMGRVQSVAVRLMCEREAEREAFRAEEYWSIIVLLAGANPPPFEAKLHSINGEEASIGNAEQAGQNRVGDRRAKRLRCHVDRAEGKETESSRAVHHEPVATGGRPETALHAEENDDPCAATLRRDRDRSAKVPPVSLPICERTRREFRRKRRPTPGR